MEKKFINSFDVEDYEVFTDDGWKDIKKIHQTVPYTIWTVNTDKHTLHCADNHILFNKYMDEVFVKDLRVGDVIQTIDGPTPITDITETIMSDNMYDLELGDDSNHRYYTEGFLSHNTVTACAFLLWFAMFKENRQVLLTSYNYDQVVNKNMGTIKTVYEYCPPYLKKGLTATQKSFKFDNKSEIIAKTTTEDTVRGTSPSVIYSDELAFTFKGNLKKQELFYASVGPAVSTTLGSIFITSTPASLYDTFSKIWNGANTFVDLDGNQIPPLYCIVEKDKNDKNIFIVGRAFNTHLEAERYIEYFTKKLYNAEVYPYDELYEWCVNPAIMDSIHAQVKNGDYTYTEMMDNLFKQIKDGSIKNWEYKKDYLPKDYFDKAVIIERNNVGKNGYIAKLTTWRELPNRDEKWEKMERLEQGDDLFEREFNCLSGDMNVTLKHKSGLEITLPIKTFIDMYGHTLELVDDKEIIAEKHQES